MADNCWSSIDLCATQFNRNDCDGNVLNGPEDVVVTCTVVDYTLTPIEGEDNGKTDPNGFGGYCAERESKPSVEGYDIELTICSKIDPVLMDLLGLFTAVRDANGDVVGYEAKCCEEEECACDPGETGCAATVSMILWHTAWCDKARHPDYKWAAMVLPNVEWKPSSVSITRNSDFQPITLTGRVDCNDNYLQGPGDFWPDPAGLDTCFGEILTNEGPANICECDMCGYAPAGTAVGN